jgi:hypothetical protein
VTDSRDAGGGTSFSECRGEKEAVVRSQASRVFEERLRGVERLVDAAAVGEYVSVVVCSSRLRV